MTTAIHTYNVSEKKKRELSESSHYVKDKSFIDPFSSAFVFGTRMKKVVLKLYASPYTRPFM